MQIDLTFATAAVYPLLLLLLALLFTFFIYRATTPAVATWLRRALALLRTLALAAALLLLFEPTLSLAWRRTEKPAVAILLDQSASMTLSDSLQTRADAVRKTMAMPWLEQLRERANVFLFSFSDSLKSLPPESLATLRYDGDGSNLAQALSGAKRQLAKHHYQAAILLSDGAYNLGSNPSRQAESYGLPILTVRLGTPQLTRDALIQEVVTNEVAYAETRLPVEVTISATGLAGRSARLHIAEGDREVAAQEIRLPADQTQVTVTLAVTPTTVGLNRYTARLEALPGELTTENNRRTFYVKVLKSKLKIWIFAGAPSADYTFLRRAVSSDGNFVVQGFVQRPGGSFYATPEQPLPAFESEEAWQPVDAVMLIDFPRRDSNRALLEMLARQLAEKGKPFFYLHGPGVDLNLLWRLRPALPFAALPNSMSEQVISLQFFAAGLSHPVTRPLTERFAPAAGGAAAVRGSDELPPLFCNLYNVKPAAGAELLAGLGAGSRAEPLWLAQKTAARKTLVILTYGIWRWKSLLTAVGKSSDAYDAMMTGLVRWLVTREDSKLVRFESHKEVYRGGEQIELTAQVYHEDYQPFAGARVRAHLTGPQFDQEIALQDVGSGLYRGRLQVLGGGEYFYRGTAEFGERKLGEDSGRFSVEPFSLEFLDTRLHAPLLQQIAQLSGGAYLPPDSLAAYLQRLPLEPAVKRESYNLALWGRPSVLIVLLLTLGAEWFIRRRQGML